LKALWARNTFVWTKTGLKLDVVNDLDQEL
jgi:hypothetical protein